MAARGDLVVGKKETHNHYHGDAAPPIAGPGIAPLARALQPVLEQYFSLDDMNGLLFELGIPDGAVSGDTLNKRSRAITAFAQQRGQLEALRAAMAVARPNLRVQLNAMCGLAQLPEPTPEPAAPAQAKVEKIATMGINVTGEIKAKRVVDGVLAEGVDPSAIADVVKAAASISGGIGAAKIEADDVVRGVWISAAKSPESFKQELATPRAQIAELLKHPEVAAKAADESEDAGAALEAADKAVQAGKGPRAQEKLDAASKALDKISKIVGTTTVIGGKLAKWGDAIGGLVAIASKVLGG